MLDDRSNPNAPPSSQPPSSLPPSSLPPSSTSPSPTPFGGQNPNGSAESAPRKQGLIARAFGLQPEEIRKVQRQETEATNTEIEQYKKRMKVYEKKAEKEWEKQKDKILYGSEGYNLGHLEDRAKWLRSHGHTQAAIGLQNHIDRIKRRLGHKFEQIEKRQDTAFRHHNRNTIKQMRAVRDSRIADQREAIRKGLLPGAPSSSHRGFLQGLVGPSGSSSRRNGKPRGFLRSLFG